MAMQERRCGLTTSREVIEVPTPLSRPALGKWQFQVCGNSNNFLSRTQPMCRIANHAKEPLLSVIGNETPCSSRTSRSLPRYFVRELNSRGGASDIDVEVSSIHRPVMILDIVVTEGPPVERKRNAPGFARIQLNLPEQIGRAHV